VQERHACAGKVEAGTYVYNSVKGKKERVGRMMEMHANSREDRKIARAGDIVALGGLKDTVTGDTLCVENKPVILEKMDFPEPVIKVCLLCLPVVCLCVVCTCPRGRSLRQPSWCVCCAGMVKYHAPQPSKSSACCTYQRGYTAASESSC
jgi:hypothetical protein